jgi:hypothetical protein
VGEPAGASGSARGATGVADAIALRRQPGHLVPVLSIEPFSTR